MNKIYSLTAPVRLTCQWAPTGNPRCPLACVWAASKAPKASTASSTDETGRMRLCA